MPCDPRGTGTSIRGAVGDGRPLADTEGVRVRREPANDLSVVRLSEAARGHDLDEDLSDLLDTYEQYALNTITWYMIHKRRKSHLSRALRSTSIVLAAAGALVPLTGPFTGMESGYWGYVLLGAAAACVAYDHFFGLSSAWARDVVTALRLQRALHDFQLAWVRVNTAVGHGEELRLARIELLSKLRLSVGDAIEAETRDWVLSFRRSPFLIDLPAGREFRPRPLRQ